MNDLLLWIMTDERPCIDVVHTVFKHRYRIDTGKVGIGNGSGSHDFSSTVAYAACCHHPRFTCRISAYMCVSTCVPLEDKSNVTN